MPISVQNKNRLGGEVLNNEEETLLAFRLSGDLSCDEGTLPKVVFLVKNGKGFRG